MPVSLIATTFVRDGRFPKTGPVLMRVGCAPPSSSANDPGFMNAHYMNAH